MNDAEIIELRKKGLTCREISERLNVPETSIWYRMKKHGMTGMFGRGVKRGKYKPRKKRARPKQPFSLMLFGDHEFIRVLPTSKNQFDELVALLEEQGGEII